MPSSEEDPDADEILWRYVQDYNQGAAGDPLDLLVSVREVQKRAFAMDLLRSCTELKNFDLDWLASAFIDPRFTFDTTLCHEILHAVYGDMLALGVTKPLSSFASFAYDWNVIRLCAADDTFYLGEVVADSFRILERLGAGGVAVVYRGESLSDGMQYAIRVARKVSPDFDLKARELIRSECLLLNSINIDGIPRLYDLIETPSGPIGILELIRGNPPKCDPSGGSEANALRIAASVARIVDELHQIGYVHGDIKIENILVKDDGKIYLNDFNVSRSANASQHSDGEVIGTYGKMSPESLLGVAADVDIREDVYALGAFLFELLEGRGLIRPKNRDEAVVMSILIGGVHEPEYATSPADLTKAIIRSATSRHPDKRFETAQDFSEMCIAAIENGAASPEVPKRNLRLAAWRLGNNLGLIANRLARAKRSMVEESRRNDQTKLSKVFHKGVGFAMGVSLALEDGIRNASYLSIDLKEPKFSKAFANLFYRKAGLDRGAIEVFLGLIDEAEAWYRQCYEMVMESLRRDNPNELLLLSLAIQARFAPDSATAREKWASIAVVSGLPSSVCAQFAENCTKDREDDVDWERQLQDFDYRVTRWLRWGLQ